MGRQQWSLKLRVHHQVIQVLRRPPFSSVAQPCLTLQPHGLHHTRLPCPSPTLELAQTCPLTWWCYPLSCFLLSPSPPAFNLSQHQGLSSESALHIRWPKYWSFSFSLSLSSEYLGLISFRKDWLDLLAVQGTLKSLLQNCSSKASILRHSAFFIFQLSHPYMTTGKTKALARQTFVGKVMSLLFNMLSRWKSWLKTQHSENEDHGIWSHHFMANRWGSSGNSVRLCFGGLQNHCRWWLQPWN